MESNTHYMNEETEAQEIKLPAQGHTANICLRQDLDSGLHDSQDNSLFPKTPSLFGLLIFLITF